MIRERAITEQGRSALKKGENNNNNKHRESEKKKKKSENEL